MSPEKRFWTILYRVLRRISLRIFLEGSQPTQLIFFTQNHEQFGESPKFGEKIRPCVERPAGAEDLGAMGPMGPMGAHGGPMGFPLYSGPISCGVARRAYYAGTVFGVTGSSQLSEHTNTLSHTPEISTLRCRETIAWGCTYCSKAARTGSIAPYRPQMENRGPMDAPMEPHGCPMRPHRRGLGPPS